MSQLATGAELRVTGPTGAAAVVCVNGGQRALVEGTWSASLEWLVGRLAPRFPSLGFAEVRYRIKSWNRFEWCVEDARAAVREVGAPRTLLVGFSMGGGVAVAAADEPSVEAVLGLAPWIPDQVDLERLHGRRLDVVHGSLDRPFLGIPGVTAASSRRAFDRARTLGIPGEYTRIPGASHGIAMRARGGRTIPLPRARAWERLMARELERFERSRSINGR
jgi:dienelactone hydrolase